MAAHVLIFGDNQTDKVLGIRKLYKFSRTRPQLRKFLQSATDTVQLHLSALAASHEGLDFGRFNNLLELAEHVQAAVHPEAVANAVLITASQIGEVLCLAETDTSILSGCGNVYPLGFCIGLLAASVVAGARDTSELVRLGVEVVGVSCRLALELRRRARLIEDSPRGWSAVIVGPRDDIEARLETFNRALPSLKRAYRGVVVTNWTTIFGPPSTLATLMSSTSFEDFPKTLHAGTTAVHAPHLPSIDIDGIVGGSLLFEGTPVYRVTVSCSTCRPFQATTVKELLENAVVDIATSSMWPEGVVKELRAILEAQEIVVTEIGPSCYTPMVRSLLQLQGRNVTTRSNPTAPLDAPTVTSRGDSGLIAIVGMSGRFPGCNDKLEEFWDLLVKGRSTHEEIPTSRFTLEDVFDPTQTLKNAVLNRFGCFLKNPGLFDHGLFEVSPREAMQMDPLHRMLLMTTFEALEQAGYGGTKTNSTRQDRISTFFSQTTDDWRTINDQQGIDTHYAPCSNRAFASGRVAHYFGWRGGAYSVDTACSSSATSIHLACNLLRNRECDTAVVGGGSLCVLPEPFSGLGKGGFLSLSTENGSCKTFQDSADGYCRGEAVGVVVLKRLEDAASEKDEVLAVIRGSARNSNAGGTSITFPSEAAQVALFQEILRKCDVEPDDVGFIEMHGTGTQAGDKVEMSSVRQVFGQHRTADNPLYVGAVKANVGHSEAAAGVVSLIKTVLMLRHDGAVPAQPGFPFALNRNFGNLAACNIKIAGADGHSSSFQAWSRGDGRRKVCYIGPHDHHPCGQQEAAATVLDRQPSVDVGDVAYTTTARRLHQVHRDAFVASSVAELCDLLAQPSPVTVTSTCKSTDPSSLVFVFTGEGSLYAGMGATLYQTCPYFRRILDSFQAASDAQGQQANFIAVITGATVATQASTPIRHMAIVALEIALAHFWQSLGLSPSLLIGHSLGEYAALCIAGVLSVSDALYLVFERAVLIEKHCQADSHAMLAIAEPASHVSQRLNNTHLSSCEISCVNGPLSTVVSGTRADLAHLKSILHDEDIKTTELSVRYAFHSAQMDPVLDPFQDIAAGIVFAKPQIPVASTLLAEIVTEKGVFGSLYLKNQMRRPVNMLPTVQACQAAGLIKDGSNLIEVGPTPICASLIARSLQNVSVNFWGSLQPAQDDWKSVNTILARAYVAGLPVDWQELYRYDLQSVQLIDLPKYAFDLKNYWHSYQKQGATPILNAPDISPSARRCAWEKLPLLYTGLQYLETIDIDNAAATFFSDIAEPNLSRAIHGHLVDGIPICPASVFIDMAITAATWILHRIGTMVKASDLEIVHMNMIHPLMAHPSSERSQSVRIHAELQKPRHEVAIEFSTEDQGGILEHCACTIRVHSSYETWNGEWIAVQKLVKDQVKALKRDAEAGAAYHMNTAVMYKLFDSLVHYSSDYMATKETFVALDFSEAASTVNLRKTFGPGNFTLNPFAVDALLHLAGFLLNANFSKPAGDIHIANHIGSLHVLEDLNAITSQTCTSFATIRKQTTGTQTWCDLYVYDDQKLIALCSVRFQKLSLDMFRSVVTKACGHILPAVELPTSKNRSVDAVGSGYNNDDTEGFDLPDEKTSDLLLSTIARHTGIDTSEIKPSCGLTDLGIDSLMSLAMIRDCEKALSLRLPAGFFTEMETVADALAALQSLRKHATTAKTSSSPRGMTMDRPSPPIVTDANHNCLSGRIFRTDEYVSTSSDWTDSSLGRADTPQGTSPETSAEGLKPVDSGSTTTAFAYETAATEAKVRPLVHTTSVDTKRYVDHAISRTVLIQGGPDNNERPLYLITDGSGTVSGYIHLPALPGGRRMYALESPFVERPKDYTLSIQEMAQVFLRAIRQEQPHGPYLIGGWSAGAIYAYEICYQLAQQGEIITSLILIDMAITRPVLDACEIDMPLIEHTGVLTGVNHASNRSAETQKLHIAATVRAVAQYDPVPFPKGKEPLHTHLIWATKSLNPNANDSVSNPSSASPHSAYAAWLKTLLHAPRTHFGTHGWERLLGDNIQVSTVEGHHFSIVRLPHVKQLGSRILDAVALDAELERIE
ncbi:hypothetical protein AC578_2468 [Pseudocercospora eumusae]|uniref:Uncharacterized protein n=1 Tax=Pseudocercospora eumusae TaxID=321146 RepID=A0A139HXB3_9PEZI|nr:hypothetical protein AC578_2468 [Pseudocercospora eumusae]